MKILGGSYVFRLFYGILIIFPLTLYVFFLILIGSLNKVSIGHCVFFLLYFIISFFYLKWNVFDWELCFENQKIILKRLFSKDEFFLKESKVTVKKVFLLSSLFKLYRLIILEKSYLVKSEKPQSTFKKIFKQDEITKDVEASIRKLISYK